MKPNLGKVDRILSAFLGIVLMILGYIYSLWLVIGGGIIFITSMFSWFPDYDPFKWYSKSKTNKHSEDKIQQH